MKFSNAYKFLLQLEFSCVHELEGHFEIVLQESKSKELINSAFVYFLLIHKPLNLWIFKGWPWKLKLVQLQMFRDRHHLHINTYCLSFLFLDVQNHSLRNGMQFWDILCRQTDRDNLRSPLRLSPITVATRTKAWTVFARSNIGVVGSNSTQGMDVCLRLFCLCCPA
jgi:hypothetical protein